MQRRFIVLSTKWMYNCDAQFGKEGAKELRFKKTKWKSPIEALVKITLSKKNNRVVITLDFDFNKQNCMAIDRVFIGDTTKANWAHFDLISDLLKSIKDPIPIVFDCLPYQTLIRYHICFSFFILSANFRCQ